ncbi:MAG TPA: hypothetical protein RMH99_21900 [Sandaracinaceae bacterium LLY-WYZ-13_1]|nr:hypothetical protein [Sandaracinaceae bacterium LLY-WYZ-13_1]
MGRRWMLACLAAAPLLLAGCAERSDSENLFAAIFGAALALVAAMLCLVSVYTSALGAGMVTVFVNLKKPTRGSKRWGWVFGVVNVLFGLAGIGLLVMAAGAPERSDPDAVEGLVYLVGGTLASLGAGGAGIWTAARARVQTA